MKSAASGKAFGRSSSDSSEQPVAVAVRLERTKNVGGWHGRRSRAPRKEAMSDARRTRGEMFGHLYATKVSQRRQPDPWRDADTGKG